MRADEAAIGLGSAVPRTMIPYSVSMPRTFTMATRRRYPSWLGKVAHGGRQAPVPAQRALATHARPPAPSDSDRTGPHPGLPPALPATGDATAPPGRPRGQSRPGSVSHRSARHPLVPTIGQWSRSSSWTATPQPWRASARLAPLGPRAGRRCSRPTPPLVAPILSSKPFDAVVVGTRLGEMDGAASSTSPRSAARRRCG